MGAKVVVYTMSGCPHCAGVKDYLKERGVEYTERNVLEDDQAMADFKAMGFKGTPVTVVGDTSVVGFDKKKLDAAVGGAGEAEAEAETEA